MNFHQKLLENLLNNSAELLLTYLNNILVTFENFDRELHFCNIQAKFAQPREKLLKEIKNCFQKFK